MALTPGFVLDRFTVDYVISTGVSAITYRVTDITTGSPFVLWEHIPAGRVVRDRNGMFKAVDEPSGNLVSMAVARFLADAAASASLHHPGIARISRWFKANGTAYLVMPWLPGKPLDSMIRGGQTLSAAEALAVALPLLDTLEYLHGRQVIHQQVGPEFIYIPEEGSALLLGSGVTAARYEGAGAADSGNACAALEQSMSDREVGPWTDIYALAATLYHCITGNPPPTAMQRWAALQAGTPDPLRPIKAGAADSQTQREIATLITRGLALEPSARPHSVREWRARITRLPAGVDEQKTASASHDAAERRQWLPRILLGALLVVIVGMGAYLFLTRTTGAPPNRESATRVQPPSQEETQRWHQALEVNAVVGYRAFMKDFPQSAHLQQAQEHIDELEDKAWQQVVTENTKAAYEAHLAAFPQGRHAIEALAKIEEFKQKQAKLAREHEAKMRQDDADWEIAKAAGSLAALDSYISTWPGGAHVSEARDLRKKLQYGINDTSSFKSAEKKHTIAAYRSYISDYPDGRHVSAAQDAIESLTLRPGKTFRDCADCPLMMVVPAGAFWQGSADTSALAISIEKPRHRVVIAEPFAVSVYEITMAEWDACAADAGCDTHPSDNAWGRGTRPVMMVSWNDAMQYASWISTKTGQAYTLPSESQWEYFARAGEESDWLGGSAASICQYGNIAGNETNFEWRHKDCADGAAFSTTPAGSYKPNAFGLYDVIGNVAEWTLDCMNLSYLEAPADGSAWTRGMCSSHMTRGGSWFTGTKESRLSARFNLKNGDRNDFTGFRLVRQVEKQ